MAGCAEMVNRSDESSGLLPQALCTPHAGGQRRETGMGLRDDEQRALDAIEYELLSGDPQLRDCFSALDSTTPPVKPVKASPRTAPVRKQARPGPRRCTGNQISATMVDLVLVIIAVVLIVMLIVGVVWMPAALGH